MKKTTQILGLIILCSLLLTFFASAEDTAYTSFTYDAWGNPVEGPSGFEPTSLMDGFSLGVPELTELSDVAASPDGNTLYILSAGGNKIVKTDKSYQALSVIENITKGGEPSPLNNPRGLFIDTNNDIYVADKENRRVVCLNEAGEITKEFTRPESDMFPPESDFLPLKVVCDRNGIVYILCENVYFGAVMYSPQGEFLGFFGCNKVESNFQVVFNQLLKTIIRNDSADKLAKYVPTQYTNLYYEQSGFVYTCTNTLIPSVMVKKLNAKGVNILEGKALQSAQGGFGNVRPSWNEGKIMYSSFADLCVDAMGYIYCLDSTTNKVFVYDKNANLLFTFGGNGTRFGLFTTPEAIEYFNGSVLVVDGNTSKITVFSQTEFGAAVNKAVALYQEGKYEEAVGPWEDVLKYNSNFLPAYTEIGKAKLEAGDIKGAVEYFTIARNRTGYNQAFGEYRTTLLREYFPVLFVLFLLIVIYIYGRNTKPARALKRRLGVKEKTDKGLTPFKSVTYVLFHPAEGFGELLYLKRDSLAAANTIALLLFLALIANRQLSGFSFTMGHNPNDFNILMYLAQSVGLIIAFTGINWGICTLFDGKGRMRAIWNVTCYSLAPLMLSIFVSTLLSNFLTTDEAIFLSIITGAGALYSAILFLQGIRTCHEYTFPKTIMSIAATVAGIFLLLFLGMLVFSVSQQFAAFVTTIFQEISLRR